LNVLAKSVECIRAVKSGAAVWWVVLGSACGGWFLPSRAVAGDLAAWADPTLPVRDGLLVWLDATRLAAAWQAHGKPALYTGAALDVWYDGSGNGLHFVQPGKDAQPRLIATTDRAVVRFDGKSHWLGATRAGQTLDEFTVLLVAAPRANPGGFRALLAAHETAKNDYLTGFNLDQSFLPGDRFGQLNVEGRGFVGAVNLLQSAVPFGEFHTIELTSSAGAGGVRLFLDGRAQGRRDREPGRLNADGLSLGARFYSNSPEPPAITGFLDGDVAELILFDRLLNDRERAGLREYLSRKHAGLSAAIAAADRRGGRLLKPIDHPPPVQMLVPGFAVRELPLQLTNINNLRYRHDGKLVALAYNGNVYILSDTNGDGLEDRAELFWENQGRLRGPIGLVVTPRGYPHGSGVLVPSKGKLSLLVDTNGDDRADREIVVATGWKEIPQAVDAIGVALAPDGSIYFGLGTANYANGYLLDEQGKSHYDIRGERGTVLRVSPDLKTREIVCTGVRFPVSMAFRNGDLFCTDQEGATWLPNGNPFDELLHIVPGRHYGFPPRHPRHLRGVVDEPSVFDFGPQHQSTCGLFFNEPVNGGPTFGPARWAGDGLVCGESRGKLFRTSLAQTAAGYVATNQTIACLGLLTVDSCVSAAGDLLVACHTGPPDWGTGPEGRGRLFQVRYVDRAAPQPVRAWPASPQEVRVAFDRPLDPLTLKNLTPQVAIEYGTYVRAGDRFETLQPPYAVVRQQLDTPRFDLPVFAAQLSADRRTLLISTAAHAEPVHYAVTLPRPAASAAPTTALPQLPTIDLDYDLTGATATWKPAEGAAVWTGWLPHLDLDVSRAFTAGSAEHDALWPLLNHPGQLTLQARLDLWNMLRPAVQPGSTLDYTPGPERVKLTIRATAPVEVRLGSATAPAREQAGTAIVTQTVEPREGEWLPVELRLRTGSTAPRIALEFTTSDDDHARPLPLRRVRLPWSTARPATTELAARPAIPELQGGDWLRGRHIYSAEPAACAKCHTLRGRGARIGPDLGNLPHRDYASVLRDILQPSAAINPDHVGYTVALKDGRVISGVPLAATDLSMTFGDHTGREVQIAKSDIEELKPAALSIMPADLGKQLDATQLRDLLTYLMTEPLEPASLQRRDAPPPRRRSEVESLLKPDATGIAAAGSPRKLHIALVAGPKDHGPDEHDYPLWQQRWSRLLRLAENIEVSEAAGWPTSAQWARADVIACYSANPAWTAAKAPELDAFLARGGGLVFLHFAVNGGSAPKPLADRIGLVADLKTTRYRHGPLELSFPDPKHPITLGFGTGSLQRAAFVDESYWNMTGDAAQIHLLATGEEEGKPRPLLWTREQGKGRVFVSILGHYTWTFDDPLFRVLLLRGLMWTAREPADRLLELSTIGARVGL
jgi:putative heme-binding domain-containing protein